jgi:hypothetical protein
MKSELACFRTEVADVSSALWRRAQAPAPRTIIPSRRRVLKQLRGCLCAVRDGVPGWEFADYLLRSRFQNARI